MRGKSHFGLAFFFLVLFLLLPLVFPQAQTDPKDVKKIGIAKIEVTSNITIEFEQEPIGIDYVNFSTFYPSDSTYQKTVFFYSNVPYQIVDSDEGKMVVYTIASPKKTNVIRTDAIVRIDYSGARLTDNKDSSDDAGDLNDPQNPYLNGGSLVILDNQVQGIANQLKRQSDLETITAIVDWTNKYITYDEAYANTNLSTRQILELKRGTCDEYAHLALALARANGIPARFPIGYVYSGQKWDLHAWVEFYIPGYGWIEADPTYNELGRIDASHVRLAYGSEQSKILQRISTFGTGQTLPKVKSHFGIKFVDTESFDSQDLEVGVASSDAAGDLQRISIGFANKDSYELFVPYDIYGAKGLEMQSPSRGLVLVKPGQTKEVEVLFKVPKPEENVIYTYPYVVSTPYSDTSLTFTWPPGATVPTKNNEPGDTPAKPTPEKPATQCLSLYALVAALGLFAAWKK
ncbi:transglutaminase domain-containing protein [Candidatus Parvarchaeota archaeon]|nr:transglutaminase domain-containing protein [Candidatus Parvarchaeota archaeon]